MTSNICFSFAHKLQRKLDLSPRIEESQLYLVALSFRYVDLYLAVPDSFDFFAVFVNGPLSILSVSM